MWRRIQQFFQREPALRDPLDFSLIHTDVHSHFIPGIDDGSKDMEQSMALLSAMEGLGYKKVITTPHVMSDTYRNTRESILVGAELLRNAAHKNGLNIQVECAAEYYLDADFMQLVKQKQLLTFGDNYVLFELPFIQEPPNLAEVIFEMQLAGYRPVLAHPERYSFWHHDWDKFEQMINRNVLLQLNINSLTGHYNPVTKKVAEKLIASEMISLVGSDCHHMGHIQLLTHASRLEPLHRLAEKGCLLNPTL